MPVRTLPGIIGGRLYGAPPDEEAKLYIESIRKTLAANGVAEPPNLDTMTIGELMAIVSQISAGTYKPPIPAAAGWQTMPHTGGEVLPTPIPLAQPGDEKWVNLGDSLQPQQQVGYTDEQKGKARALGLVEAGNDSWWTTEIGYDIDNNNRQIKVLGKQVMPAPDKMPVGVTSFDVIEDKGYGFLVLTKSDGTQSVSSLGRRPETKPIVSGVTEFNIGNGRYWGKTDDTGNIIGDTITRIGDIPKPKVGYRPEGAELGYTFMDGQSGKLYEWRVEPGTENWYKDWLPDSMQPKAPLAQPAGLYPTQTAAMAANPGITPDDVSYDQASNQFYVLKRTPKPTEPGKFDTGPGQLALSKEELAYKKIKDAQDAADRMKALQWEATRTSGEQVNKYGMWAVENAAQEARDKSAKALATQKAFMDYSNRLQEQENIRRQEANTMAWNAQLERTRRQERGETLAFEKEKYGAQLAANPASWIESNVYNRTTPMVQPWMAPLGLTNVGQPVPTTPIPQGNRPGPMAYVEGFNESNMSQPESEAIMRQRMAATGYSGAPGTGPTAGGLTPQERTATGYTRAEEASSGYESAQPWTPQTAMPLLQPSAQAWARMSPTDLAMYGSYEKGRTGLTLEDLRNRMWATATPGAGGGGARRRY